MGYHVSFNDIAKKNLKSISRKDQIFILDKITSHLAQVEDLREYSKRLQGFPLWRSRVGNYRVIFTFNQKQKTVTVLLIAHRSEVYQRVKRLNPSIFRG